MCCVLFVVYCVCWLHYALRDMHCVLRIVCYSVIDMIRVSCNVYDVLYCIACCVLCVACCVLRMVHMVVCTL